MPKTIAIFADGTGSAFAANESNVWRLYQALDRSRPDQIAEYIKGVGTSGVRLFALIDGATGIGVPSNVRKLYRFLCWNWSHGDQIYMFGFSRGAFTIRTLIGLIDREGLVPREIDGEPVSNAEMRRNAAAAWRSYRRKTIPWNKSLPTISIARAIRDAALYALRLLLRRRGYGEVRRATTAQKRQTIPIRFVGLFDTVEAFGVPIEELRAAIDWAIWPVSFRNRVLSANVERARHALSLDDERTTFHPIRFDMTDEQSDRIREVWFAGVHSDVGGGYPDAALAHVPLLWMAEEAEKTTVDSSGRKTAGLRFAPHALDGFRDAASPLGPTHDSRAGLGVLYRYDPRPIAEDRASGGPPVIHHSVAEKMVFGSENYAPIMLPSSAFVLMPGGARHRIAGFSARAALTGDKEADPELGRALKAVDLLSAPDPKLAALTLDTVWWRRVAYYALLVSVLLAASLPITAYWLTSAFKSSVGALLSLVGLGSRWDAYWESLAGANEGISTNLGSISKTAGGFVPGYLRYWVDVAVARPITSAVVLLIVLALYQANSALRDLICDRARLAWFFAGRRAPPGSAKPGLLMRLAGALRQSGAARALYLATTRFILPGLALFVILAAGAVTLSRTTVSYRAGRGDFCASTKTENLRAASETPAQAATEFEIDRLCWASGVRVEKGRQYLLSITMTRPFLDQTYATDIAGFRASSFNYLMGLPIRRWWSADWFQPIVRVGARGSAEQPLAAVDGAEAVPLGFDSDGKRIPPDEAEAASRPPGLCDKVPEGDPVAAGTKPNPLRKTYVSQFAAPETGELFLYLNDAIAAVPFGPTIACFYDNNRGAAKVVIKAIPAPRLEAGAKSPHD